MRPIAMPATGALSGTPADSSDIVDAQTEPIDVDPLEPSASDTWRIAYGNSSRLGSTGISARSASAPCPISRRFGAPTRPVSPVEYGGEFYLGLYRLVLVRGRVSRGPPPRRMFSVVSAGVRGSPPPKSGRPSSSRRRPPLAVTRPD